MATCVGDPPRVLVAWRSATRGEELATALRDRIDESTVVLATGVEAVRSRVEAGTVDCVVSDHDPPAMDGVELLQRVRACDRTLPVLLSPAPETDPVVTGAVDADVTAYVPREQPVPSAGPLSDRIRGAIESRRLRRDRAAAADRFGALVENMADAVVVVDEESTIQYANPALERVLGYKPCEVRGEELTTLVPQRFEGRHLGAVRDFLDTGEPSVDWTGVEFPAVHAAGHRVPVEVAFGEFEHGDKHFFVGSIRERSD